MSLGFSWVEHPHVAALARPLSVDDLKWLRDKKIDLLVTLTEEPLPRHWINEAGLMCLHLPIYDMYPPTLEQIQKCNEAIEEAKRTGMGVAIHCAAGRGRTGTMLAGYLVSQGMDAQAAIAKVRELRPGSIETMEQVEVVEAFACSIERNEPEA